MSAHLRCHFKSAGTENSSSSDRLYGLPSRDFGERDASPGVRECLSASHLVGPGPASGHGGVGGCPCRPEGRWRPRRVRAISPVSRLVPRGLKAVLSLPPPPVFCEKPGKTGWVRGGFSPLPFPFGVGGTVTSSSEGLWLPCACLPFVSGAYGSCEPASGSSRAYGFREPASCGVVRGGISPFAVPLSLASAVPFPLPPPPPVFCKKPGQNW